MSTPNPSPPTFYRLEIQGSLGADWADWLNGAAMRIEPGAGGNTCLIVGVPDQAALRGLLGRIWDLNLTLVALQRLDQDTTAKLSGMK